MEIIRYENTIRIRSRNIITITYNDINVSPGSTQIHMYSRYHTCSDEQRTWVRNQVQADYRVALMTN